MTRPATGLLPKIKHFFYSAASSTPKIRHYTTSTPSETVSDTSLQPEAYRWFRRDELVRRCVVVNAGFASMAGFDTELEPVDDSLSEDQKKALAEQYKYVKVYVDQINKEVNLDNTLFIAQVKRCIYGKAGFEIIFKGTSPSWLLSLQSPKLEPNIDTDTWKLLDFKYEVASQYQPEDLLYFVNLQLENDYVGLSDIEPVFPACNARHHLLKHDFPKITRNLWAPYAVLQADTVGMTDADEDTFLASLSEDAESGKSLAVNKAVTATIVSLTPDLNGLIMLMEKLEETIIRAFGTPRFLLCKPNENRATAYTEFEAYISGPIANVQRYFKRELEAQWYPRLVKAALTAKGFVGDVPVKVRHVWKPIRASDVYEMATAVTNLYQQGYGILADYPDIAFDMLGWDKKRLLEEQEKQKKEQQNNPQQPPLPNQPGKTTTPRTDQQQQTETVKPNA